jgi:serine/threonine protein kinase
MSYSITGYSKLRKIAEGGRGVVYSGIKRFRNRKVAIKILSRIRRAFRRKKT